MLTDAPIAGSDPSVAGGEVRGNMRRLVVPISCTSNTHGFPENGGMRTE